LRYWMRQSGQVKQIFLLRISRTGSLPKLFAVKYSGREERCLCLLSVSLAYNSCLNIQRYAGGCRIVWRFEPQATTSTGQYSLYSHLASKHVQAARKIHSLLEMLFASMFASVSSPSQG